jgi:hypothetical protein
VSKGVLHVVLSTHLLGLQIYTDNFETSQGEKCCVAFLKADTYWDWVQCGVA